MKFVNILLSINLALLVLLNDQIMAAADPQPPRKIMTKATKAPKNTKAPTAPKPAPVIRRL
eukprot:7976783-Ditylum_brightwellii.AAC.1